MNFREVDSKNHVLLLAKDKPSYVPVRMAYSSFEPNSSNGSTSLNTTTPPIIFLHGLTSCKETWASIPQIFANQLKRKVYTVDARNHGDSGWSDYFTTDDLVNDLLFFMDAIQADRAILIGHSMGGTIAIQMAIEAPEKVEMIVVEEMFVSRPPDILLELPLMYVKLAPIAVQMVPNDADDMQATHFILDYVNKALPPGLENVHTPSKVDKSTMALRRNAEGRFSLKANMAALEKSLMNPEDTIKEVQGTYPGPACFIYGNLSPFQVPLDAETITKCFPNAVFIGIDDAKHTVHSDNPPAFINAVLKFIVTNIVPKNRL
ncbi:hypothetical protein NPIL_493431 [Nephila pilipes]|uniref:sn-1-specific diacylglycerol lipase ABHD11 n=1 Tax=Nephila pilipes TaxID=299642 RepID=A0A8X6QXU9_NEPPI|nr:hypothetical protein NPIL_493431 [Nephila pilipes]